MLPSPASIRRSPSIEPQYSVANVSQIVAIDRALLTRHVGRLSKRQLELVFAGIAIVFDR